MIKSGKKIKDFDYMKPREFEMMLKKKKNQIKKGDGKILLVKNNENPEDSKVEWPSKIEFVFEKLIQEKIKK